MSYHITHRHGGDESEPPVSSFAALLRELDGEADDEHAFVALTHESEWCLSVSCGGFVIWENVESEDAEPRHMTGVPDSDILRLWRLLAEGRIEEIDKEAWKPGYE